MGLVSGRYLGAVSGRSVEIASRPLVRKRVRVIFRHILRALVMDRFRTRVGDIEVY